MLLNVLLKEYIFILHLKNEILNIKFFCIKTFNPLSLQCIN